MDTDARRGEFAMIVGACLIVGTVLGGLTRCFALTQTTTTAYQYNDDGAVTAVTTQVDAQPPSTVYLTWDNFVPSTTDPTTGTVLAGNGNLSGFGPTPGSAFSTQFQYDQRNRLTNAAAVGAQSVSYTYYPASLMASSTLGSGDALQFYYDASAVPSVANIKQPSTATWSSYLGDVTYLSDGSEQMRCLPRKDTAGVYVPAEQSFSSSRYDPYGASASSDSSGPAVGQPVYDMRTNPFQFAGEYKEAAWGGYYLRARWYLPEYQTFLGRDPADWTHRYSYGGGNPIGNSDPTGLSYKSFSRAVNRFLRPVNTGLLGDLLPFIPVYGQVVGGIQLLGNLPEVWHHPNTRTWISAGFLVASVVTEAADSAPALDRAKGPLKAFGWRIGADLGIGVGQTLLTGYRGHDKWDVPAMFQSVAYNVSGVLWGRLAAGFGYRSHPLSSSDIDNMFATHLQSGSDEALVFKVRQPVGEASPGSGSATGASGALSERLGSGSANAGTNATLPILDVKTVGMFHEGLLAVSKDRVWYTELGTDDGELKVLAHWNRNRTDISPSEFLGQAQGGYEERRFQYAGTYPQRQVEDAIAGALPENRRQAYHLAVRAKGTGAIAYDLFSNNCQDYVKGVLGAIRRR